MFNRLCEKEKAVSLVDIVIPSYWIIFENSFSYCYTTKHGVKLVVSQLVASYSTLVVKQCFPTEPQLNR